MRIQDYIAALQTPKTAHSSILIHGADAYPSVFGSLWWPTLANAYNLSFITLDFDKLSFSAVEQTLQTSFLGSRIFYILKGVAELDAKQQIKLVTFIQCYEGPHVIACWLPKTVSYQVSSHGIHVEIPDAVDQELFLSLAHFFNKKRATQRVVIKAIFARYPTLSYDVACLIMEYIGLIGQDVSSFTDAWLDRIVAMPQSLFTLSQHFFDKSSSEFARTWHQIKDMYQMPFWCTFWSEQLFRAASVVQYNKEHNSSLARKVGYRLPFSLLNRGWQRLTYQELQRAHDFVYQLDLHIKNGGSTEMLDLFYAKFFSGDFTKA